MPKRSEGGHLEGIGPEVGPIADLVTALTAAVGWRYAGGDDFVKLSRWLVAWLRANPGRSEEIVRFLGGRGRWLADPNG